MLEEELRDRFGLLPEAVENVLKVARLRVLAAQGGMSRVAMTAEGFKVSAGEDELAALTVWTRLAADHPGVDDVGWLNDSHIGVKVKNWAKGRRLEKTAKILRAYIGIVESDIRAGEARASKRREAAVAARE